MPRDASGTYTLPAGNPVVTLTTVSSTWANDTLSDIAAALTASLSAPLLASNGMVARTSASTFAARTLTGTANKVTVTNGDGQAGNPTFTLPAIINQEGIQFPATQVPSANANCLDDYEEGDWTPGLTFDTPGNLNVVFSSQVGKYTKIGRLVLLEFFMATSTFTHTTASGSLRVTGVPFTQATGIEHAGSLSRVQGINAPGTSFPMVSIQREGAVGTTLVFYQNNTDDGSSGGLPETMAPTGVQKVFTGMVAFIV